MESTIYTRIKALCQERNITVSRLEQAMGFSNGTVSKWREGGSSPAADKISKIAEYFGVTCDYLLGVSDHPYRLEETDDADIVSLQRARQRMSQKDRDRMMQMLKIGFDYAFQDDEGDER